MLLSVNVGNDSEKVLLVYKQYLLWFWQKVNWYKKLNQNSKSKKGYNSYKNLERVMYSCLSMEVMMVNKYCKCISYISNGFAKKWGGTKNLTKILSGKRAIILKKHGQSYVL